MPETEKYLDFIRRLLAEVNPRKTELSPIEGIPTRVYKPIIEQRVKTRGREAMPKKLAIGVMAPLNDNVTGEIAKVRGLGLSCCQLDCWNPDAYTRNVAQKLRRACGEHGVMVTTLWSGYPGPAHWNFAEGPATIGFVPPEFREMRVAALVRAAEFAAGLGIPSITTHAGFIPENPKDPLYAGTIEALAIIARECLGLGLEMWFETGQETPITLLRAIRDIGTGNLGVNLDPANLLMYGKANPIDALDILGPYVKGVHAKDGEYPTEPGSLGVEKPLGEGRVDFPRLIAKLKSFGYTGALTIEREITGEQQIIDIERAIEYLGPMLGVAVLSTPRSFRTHPTSGS